MALVNSQLQDENPINPNEKATLVLNKVSKKFNDNYVLKNISLDFQQGQIYGIQGQNGAGKSTLMKIIAGVHTADSGEINLFGKDFKANSPLAARQQGVAMIYQELAIAGDLSVADNIFLGQEKCHYKNYFGLVNSKLREKITKSVLTDLGHPEIKPNQLAKEYSIGIRQLIEIARAVVSGCKILILDEPTTSLSSEDREKLFAILNTLKKQNIIVLYISHYLDEVFKICDQIYVLRDGELVFESETKATKQEVILKHMLGKEIKNEFPEKIRKAQNQLLKAIDLPTINDKKFSAIEIYANEILGLAGQLGSGRTELLETLFGLRNRHGAKVIFENKELAQSTNTAWKHGLGFLSEDRALTGLSLDLSIAENIALPKLAQQKLLSKVNFKELENTAIYWINKLKIRCKNPKQKVSELSGGNQQKVALARILAYGSQLIILDDPTRGIDLGSKSDIYNILNEALTANENTNKAILITSNYLPELLGLADRIVCIYKGGQKSILDCKDLTEAQLLDEISSASTT